MKHFYAYLLKTISATLLIVIAHQSVDAQACSTAQGNQTAYGTNNVWIGYVYTGQNLAAGNYQGYVNEGSSSSPNFNEGFGGGGVTYNTNGCSITTTNFSVRYKLSQNFTSGNYTITVGGDDGFRFSLDGGNTWSINMWQDQSYTTSTITVNLSGVTNMVLEYYQNGGANQVSFNIVKNCLGTGDTTVYGTNGKWMGYIFQGMSFNTYKGTMSEGATGNPAFNENFGNTSNSNTATFNTNSCTVTTYQFSARYRLTQTLAAAKYTFTVGGDDGYRFSIDGGNTWVINNWNDHSYQTTAYTVSLNAGTYNMVLDFYDNGGASQVSFAQSSVVTLPITLTSWTGAIQSTDQNLLKWSATDAVNFDHFIVQRSTDGESFENIATVQSKSDGTTTPSYSYVDQFANSGNVYYRLAMVDLDGTINYSTIIVLNSNSTLSPSVRIYPTVVENGALTVETGATIHQARMELYNMNGQKLQDYEWQTLEGRQSVTLGKTHLTAGAYIVRVSNDQSILAKQIIIIK